MAKRPRSAAAAAAAGEDGNNKAAKHTGKGGASAGAGAGSSSSSAAAAGGAPKFVVDLDKQITFDFSDGPVSFLPRMFEPFEDCLVMTMCASQLNAGRTSFDFKDRKGALFKSLLTLIKAGAAKTMIEKPYGMSWADYFEELEYWQVSQPLPHGLTEQQESALVACTQALVDDLGPLIIRLRQDIASGFRAGPAIIRIPVYTDRLVAIAGRLYDAATERLAALPAAGAGAGAGGAGPAGPRHTAADWWLAVAGLAPKSAFPAVCGDDRHRFLTLMESVTPAGHATTMPQRLFVQSVLRTCTVVRYTHLLRLSPYARFHVLKAASEGGALVELDSLSLPAQHTDGSDGSHAEGKLWVANLAFTTARKQLQEDEHIMPQMNMAKDEFVYFLGQEHTTTQQIFEVRDFKPSSGGSDPKAPGFKAATFNIYFTHLKVDCA